MINPVLSRSGEQRLDRLEIISHRVMTVESPQPVGHDGQVPAEHADWAINQMEAWVD